MSPLRGPARGAEQFAGRLSVGGKDSVILGKAFRAGCCCRAPAGVLPSTRRGKPSVFRTFAFWRAVARPLMPMTPPCLVQYDSFGQALLRAGWALAARSHCNSALLACAGLRPCNWQGMVAAGAVRKPIVSIQGWWRLLGEFATVPRVLAVAAACAVDGTDCMVHCLRSHVTATSMHLTSAWPARGGTGKDDRITSQEIRICMTGQPQVACTQQPSTESTLSFSIQA